MTTACAALGRSYFARAVPRLLRGPQHLIDEALGLGRSGGFDAARADPEIAVALAHSKTPSKGANRHSAGNTVEILGETVRSGTRPDRPARQKPSHVNGLCEFGDRLLSRRPSVVAVCSFLLPAHPAPNHAMLRECANTLMAGLPHQHGPRRGHLIAEQWMVHRPSTVQWDHRWIAVRLSIDRH